jgi:formate/nitrite transporter
MAVKSPTEILAFVSDLGVVKTQRKMRAVLILSFFAGVYIAFAGGGSSMAAHNLLATGDMFGIGRVLLGVVFTVGLMLVLLAGAELFTGNNLILISVMDRKVKVSQMFLNWIVVWTGNLVGSLFIAWMWSQTGLFNTSGGLLGGVTINIAAGKTGMAWHSAFISGILCNWLVCLAVWVSFASQELIGKIVAIFFIIALFATSGFEHSVANMYYISAGIFASAEPRFVEMSNYSAGQIGDILNWGTFFVKNLIPVTLGNIVGGAFFVGVLYQLSLAPKKSA